MIVAGIGFRKGTSAEEIEEAVRSALQTYDVARIDAIATESGKADDPAVMEVAKRLDATVAFCAIDDLGSVAHRVLTPSGTVMKVKGVPSIAEGSAVFAAGGNARLLGPRVATARATCALAEGEGR